MADLYHLVVIFDDICIPCVEVDERDMKLGGKSDQPVGFQDPTERPWDSGEKHRELMRNGWIRTDN